MEFPIFNLSWSAGGFWIALVSILHVYVAQFAVGGGLFLVTTEILARKRDSVPLLNYVKKHTQFFLLLTMVFGGLSGVGIWFTIAQVSPDATLALIHNFVFGWAAEWTCFLAEIIALLIYFYGWDRLTAKQHVTIGWIYFFFGFMSLYLVNWIIAAMLTPGDWLTTGSFWDAFLNPSTWPQLVFRSFLCFALAGLFGFVTATRIEHEETRELMVRRCAIWTFTGMVLTIAAGWWYVEVLPEAQYLMVMEKSHRVSKFMRLFWYFSPAVMVGALLLAIRFPRKLRFSLAMVVLVIGLGMYGSFEFVRESARKPYTIWGYIYSNAVFVDKLEATQEKGLLETARWTPDRLREINDDNAMEVGHFLYQLQCSSCHSIGGPINDLRPQVEQYNIFGMDAFIAHMEKLNPYMPPFAGNEAERAVLARYLVTGLAGNPEQENLAVEDRDIPVEVPEASAEYTLLAWPERGVKMISDSPRFSLRAPGISFKAMLIKRGNIEEETGPELLSEDVTLSYTPEQGFEKSVRLDEYRARYGSEALGTLSGDMVADEEGGTFRAVNVPVYPYKNDEGFLPYPAFHVTARDADGNVLAETRVVLPISTELGCKNCHGGEWAVGGVAGMTDSTAMNVLATHDRFSRTDLVDRAERGEPIVCQSCHGDPDTGDKGDPERLNMSAAIHGFHAVYLQDKGSEACNACHPSRDEGPTRFLRGQHYDMGFECTNCHGPMDVHALSLLKVEARKKRGAALIAMIEPQTLAYNEIEPRMPWHQQPDCLTCHIEFGDAESDEAFNQWTESPDMLYIARKGEMEMIPCAACHNAPHMISPNTNMYGESRATIQPRQLGIEGPIGSEGSCTVCHAEEMVDALHHPGMGLEE